MWSKLIVDGSNDLAGEVVIIRIKTKKKSIFQKAFQMCVAFENILDDLIRETVFRYIEDDLYDNLVEIAKNINILEIKFLFVGPNFPKSSKDFKNIYAYAFGMVIDGKDIPKEKAQKLLNDVGLDWAFD